MPTADDVQTIKGQLISKRIAQTVPPDFVCSRDGTVAKVKGPTTVKRVDFLRGLQTVSGFAPADGYVRFQIIAERWQSRKDPAQGVVQPMSSSKIGSWL